MISYNSRQIKDNLDRFNHPEAKHAIKYLQLNNKKMPQVPQMYIGICEDIQYILKKFEEMPKGMEPSFKALNIKQLGYVIDKMGNSWPDFVIIQALQYHFITNHNKFFTYQELIQKKFSEI